MTIEVKIMSPEGLEELKLPADPEAIVEKVRERYGALAKSGTEVLGDGCCAGPAPAAISRRLGYGEADLALVPEEADLGLGCGAPIASLDLQPGEVVLDLGSGPGLDALLAARQVGPEGKVIGVDMTEEMIRRARSAADQAGFDHVEFRQGRLEALPVADASVDAVTSNCVINLVPDKALVFREVARVLKPGGRLVIADVVLAGELPQAIGRSLLAYVGCVSGAMQIGEYLATVEAAGLTRVEVLRDVDALALFADSVPPDAAELLADAKVDLADLTGKVRSITFRAYR